jgi:hypothetical protein
MSLGGLVLQLRAYFTLKAFNHKLEKKNFIVSKNDAIVIIFSC